MDGNGKNRSALGFAFRSSLPVMAGYLVIGLGFGMLLQSKGYAWWWAALMSLTIYAGSMQYVAIDLLASGASLVAAALMTLMVNIRHLFYGVAMLKRYENMGAAKPYLIFSLTDETFSLVCSPELPADVEPKRYDLFVSILDQCYWVLGSLAGGVIGNALTFNTAGIDFAMTALFVVIFVEQWEKTGRHLPALTGVCISVLCLILFGASDFLIPSMLGITAALFLEKRALDEAERT